MAGIRRAWLAGCLLLASVLVLAPPAAAQSVQVVEEWPTVPLRVGETWRVRVRGLDDFVVLDPTVVAVFLAQADVLEVRGLRAGHGVVLLLRDGQTEAVALVVDRGTAPPPDWGGRLGPRFQSQTIASLGQVADSEVWWRGWQQLEVTDAGADPERSTTARAAVAALNGSRNVFIPVLGVELVRPGVRVELGDTVVSLVPDVATSAMRGAAVRVDTPDVSTHSALGLTSRATCCSFIDPRGELTAMTSARFSLGDAPWVSGSAGFLVPLSEPTVVPYAAVGAGTATESGAAEARVTRLGSGWALTSRGASRVGPRLDADIRGVYTSKGLYRPRQGPDPRSTGLARTSWTWRATDATRIQPLLAFSRRGSDGVAPRRDQLSGGVGQSVRWAGGSGFDTGLLATRIFEVGSPASGVTSGRLGAHSPWAAVVSAQGQVLAGFADDGTLVTALARAGVEAQLAEPIRAGPTWRLLVQGPGERQNWVGVEADGTWTRVDLRTEVGWWHVIASDGTFHGPQWTTELGAGLTRAVHIGLVGLATHIPDTRFNQWRADGVLTVQGPARLQQTRLPFLSGRIQGTVFLDRDGDGMQGPEEPPLADVPVEVFGRTTRTDDQGRFQFAGIPSGPKDVTIQRGDYHTVDGVVHRVQVPRSGTATTTFALSTGARLQIRVFHDRDRDGAYDIGEEGVGVTGLSVEGMEPRTAPQGLAEVEGLSDGTWSVSVAPLGLPRGWVPVAGLEREVRVAGAGVVPVSFPLAPVRTIAGAVWIDVNLNGTRDGADEPVANAEVVVRPSARILTTDAAGRFLIRDVREREVVLETRGAAPLEIVVPDGPVSLVNRDLIVPEALPVGPEVASDESGGPVVALRIEPHDLFLRAGERARLAVTAVHEDLSRNRVTEDIEWIVSGPSVLEVAPDGAVTGLRTGTTEVIAQWRGVRSAPITVEVGQIALLGLRVSPTSLSMELDDSTGLWAQALYVGGSWADATDVVEWTTSDPHVALVDARGIVRAVGPGTARVHAELQDQRTQPILVQVGLQRAFPQRLTIQGGGQQLSLNRGGRLDVFVRLADGRTVDGTSLVEFDVARPDIVRVLPGGRIEPLAEGSTEVWARWKGIRSLPEVVEVMPAEGLLVSPSPGVVRPGMRVPLAVTAVLRGGELETVTDMEWEVDDPGVARIDDGVLVAVGAGQTEIRARWRRKVSFPVSVEVVDAPVMAVRVAQADGLSMATGDRAFIDAVATLGGGRDVNVSTHAAFAVDDHDVVDVESGGVLVARGPGVARVSATWQGVPSTPITVEVRDPEDGSVPLRVVVEPDTVVVGTGRSAKLDARVLRDDGASHPVRDLAWTSADPQIALVDANGRVRAVGPGTTTVVAAFRDLESSPVTVVVPALEGMTISPPLRTVPLGTRVRLRADGVLETGDLTPLTGLVRWSSTDPKVARVEPGGDLLAIRPGIAEIQATTGSLASRTLTIEVVAAQLDRVVVDPPELEIETGSVVFLEATAEYGDLTTDQATHYAAWSSSRPEVLDVVDGAAVAGRPGIAEVYATWLGKRSDPAVVRVNHPDLVGLTVSVPEVLLLGATVRPRVSAVLTDGTLQDVTDHVVFSVVNQTVVTVEDGRLQAHNPGSTWIEASLGGERSLRAQVSVHGGQATALRIVALPQTSGRVRPRVEATLDDGRDVDVSDQVDWELDGDLYLDGGEITGAPGARGTARARWGGVRSDAVELGMGN